MEDKLKFPITARAEDLPPPMPVQSIPSVAVSNDHFVNALLGTSVSEKKPKKPLKLAVSFLLHIVVLGTLVVAPLYFGDVINVKAFQETLLVAPPSPAPPPAPMKVARAPEVAPHAIHLNQLVAPTIVPKNVTIGKDVAAPDDLAGSIGAGDSNGVLGGILGGTGMSGLAPPPPSAPATPKVVRVGGDVREPALLERVSPNYPPIARISRTQGVVVIDAVIDEHGNVVQAHAISGPPLLIAAALQAVSQWKYQPTFLNGQAVSVAMHVSVSFHLQG